MVDWLSMYHLKGCCITIEAIKINVGLVYYLLLETSGVRSIVPMIHLTWNLVRTIRIVNQTLYEQLK